MEHLKQTKDRYVDVNKPAVDYNAQVISVAKWPEMTVNELLEQKTLMLNRYDFLVSMGKDVKMILQGITQLDSIISKH